MTKHCTLRYYEMIIVNVTRTRKQTSSVVFKNYKPNTFRDMLGRSLIYKK